MRIFLSFNTKDLSLAEALRERVRAIDSDVTMFFSPVSLGAGFWVPKLADELAAADAFLLLIGEKGIGPWQELEYYNALDRHVADKKFTLVPLLAATRQAPGLPFLRTLNWVEARGVADDAAMHKLMAALKGETVATATPLWKLVNPYRGLEAMTEANADYFHGRAAETTKVLRALADHPGCCPMLVGASGVGKSSVAQAGVLSALKSMRWPGNDEKASWPAKLADSRSWVQLVMRPGEAPLAALAATVTRLWRLDPRQPEQAALPRQWANGLMRGENTLADLIDATQAELKKQEGGAPGRILLYVDQGEELYTRAAPEEARRFSQVLTEALRDPRLLAFTSLRADYFDKLQADEVLFGCRQHVDVPPLDRERLKEVVTEPARALGVAFEDDGTPERITAAAATKPGALPLLSYLLTDMWEDMCKGNEATLRLPAQAIDIGGILASRAERFLEENPNGEPVLRSLLTLRLCTVQPEGEPVRRQTRRGDCTAAEWDLACRLAEYPWRLVVTSERPDDGEIVAEVAHEALLRSWPRLEGWLRERRDFLIFKTDAERAEKRWREAGKLDDALLNGLDLTRAERWMPGQANDLSGDVAGYVRKSIDVDRRRKQEQLRFQKWVSAGAMAAAAVLSIALIVAWWEAVTASHEQSRADSALDRARETQSLFLADLARNEMNGGDYATAMLLGLAGLPDSSRPVAEGGARPYVPEAEGSVYEGYARSREKFVLAGHDSPIQSVTGGLDGKRILTVSAEATIIWDAASGRALAKIADAAGSTYAAISSDGALLVTGSDAAARIWDAATGVQRGQFVFQSAPLRALAFSPDGKRIITAHGDDTVRLWDPQTGSALSTLAGPAGPVAGVAVSFDGARIASVYEDQSVKIWDSASGNVVAATKPQELPVSSVAISRDGKWIVTGSYDKKAIVWNAATGVQIRPLEGHRDAVRSVAISPDDKRIVTGSDDKTVRLWDAATGEVLDVMAGHLDAVTSVAFTPDGVGIVSGSADKTARLWAPEASGLGKVLADHGEAASGIAFSATGNFLVSGSSDNMVRLWDTSSGRNINVLTGTHQVSSVAVDAAGTRVVSGASDGTATLWDPTSGKPIRTFSAHVGQVSVAVSRDGSRLVTGGDADRTVRVWDPAVDQPLTTITALASRVTSVLITADRTRIVTAAGTVARVWDAASGQQLIPKGLGHNGSVLCLALSADGTKIVTGARDGFAKLWDAATGALLKSFEVQGEAITGVAISPDGARIVTGSSDNKVRLWDTATGKEIATIEIDTAAVTAVAISADGTHLATGTSDGMLRLSHLFVRYQSLVTEAKRIVPRCLRDKQLDLFHLPAEPPRWCITGAGRESESDSAKWEPKWPYQSPEWREWQIKRDRGQAAPLPSS